jgi:hypothetical protein
MTPSSSSASIAVIVDSRPRGNYIPSTCPYCKKEIEFIKPASASRGEPYHIRCSECSETYLGPKEKKEGNGMAKGKGRRIGTGERNALLCCVELLSEPWGIR